MTVVPTSVIYLNRFSTVVFTMFATGLVYTCWQRYKMVKEHDEWISTQMSNLKFRRIVESVTHPAPFGSEEDFTLV